MPKSGLPVTIAWLSTFAWGFPMMRKSLGSLSLMESRLGGVKGGGRGGQLTVAEGAARGGMEDAARRGGALRGGDGPACGGGRDQHLPACGANAAQGQVIGLRGGASSSRLSAVEGVVEVGLLDAHMAPVGIELLGDHHGKHGLDALADLGGLGHDGDGAVRGDVDEGVGRESRPLGAPNCAGVNGRSKKPSARPPPVSAPICRKLRRERGLE